MIYGVRWLFVGLVLFFLGWSWWTPLGLLISLSASYGIIPKLTQKFSERWAASLFFLLSFLGLVAFPDHLVTLCFITAFGMSFWERCFELPFPEALPVRTGECFFYVFAYASLFRNHRYGHWSESNGLTDFFMMQGFDGKLAYLVVGIFFSLVLLFAIDIPPLSIRVRRWMAPLDHPVIITLLFGALFACASVLAGYLIPFSSVQASSLFEQSDQREHPLAVVFFDYTPSEEQEHLRFQMRWESAQGEWQKMVQEQEPSQNEPVSSVAVYLLQDLPSEIGLSPFWGYQSLTLNDHQYYIKAYRSYTKEDHALDSIKRASIYEGVEALPFSTDLDANLPLNFIPELEGKLRLGEEAEGDGASLLIQQLAKPQAEVFTMGPRTLAHCVAARLSQLDIATRVVEGFVVPRSQLARGRSLQLTNRHHGFWCEYWDEFTGWTTVEVEYPREDKPPLAAPEPDELEALEQKAKEALDGTSAVSANEKLMRIGLELGMFSLGILFLMQLLQKAWSYWSFLWPFQEQQAPLWRSLEARMADRGWVRRYGEGRSHFLRRTNAGPKLKQALLTCQRAQLGSGEPLSVGKALSIWWACREDIMALGKIDWQTWLIPLKIKRQLKQ